MKGSSPRRSGQLRGKCTRYEREILGYIQVGDRFRERRMRRIYKILLLSRLCVGQFARPHDSLR